MTRVGWIMVVLIGGALALMLATTRFGGGRLPARVIVRVPAASLAPGLLAVPVAGVKRAALVDSWGDERSGGRGHRGIDIIAPGGTAVTAAERGVVEKLFRSELGGITAYVRSPDRTQVYYYAHLAGYAPSLHEGGTVRTGDPIGFVGDTGDAGAGNTHLHFSVTRVDPGQRWWEGEDVNPYPLLVGRAGGR